MLAEQEIWTALIFSVATLMLLIVVLDRDNVKVKNIVKWHSQEIKALKELLNGGEKG